MVPRALGTGTAAPEAERLIEQTEYGKAAALLQEARGVLPRDPTLEKLWIRSTGEASFASEPRGPKFRTVLIMAIMIMAILVAGPREDSAAENPRTQRAIRMAVVAGWIRADRVSRLTGRPASARLP